MVNRSTMTGKKYDQQMAAAVESGSGMEWHSADEEPFVLEGFHWRDKGGPFRRMPPNTPEHPLPEGVDRFANHAAGGQLRFKTDSPSIMVKASVRTMNNAADIMTYSRIGFDLYAGAPQASHFVGVTKVNFDDLDLRKCSYCATVFKAEGKAWREFTLNFPLYASVDAFAIGFEPGAKFAAPSPRCDPRPIVVYGTSIQQGCCASRPGRCHTNILSRVLNRPFINLGFAGSGKGEPEVARVLADIRTPALYVLDYDSNATLESLERTLPVFTDILRTAHPETPILTVSRMYYPSDYPPSPEQAQYSDDRITRTAIHVANLKRHRATGNRQVHFLDGIMLFGDDYAECCVDDSHATDLGFYRIANVLGPEMERILSPV